MAYKTHSPIIVPEGGTGTITNTLNGVILGQGTSALSATAAGTTNTVLLGNTSAAPTFGQVPNAALVNNSITVNGSGGITTTGSPVALGGTVTIVGSGSSVFNYTVVSSSPYTVLSTDYYLGVNVTSIPITIDLPNAPSAKTTFVINDFEGLAATNNITVTTLGGTVLINGATTFVMNTNYQSINLLFDGTRYQIY